MELGLKAIKKALKNHSDPSRPNKYILQLLEISLTRNEFDLQIDLQIQGTAMSKKNCTVICKHRHG